MKEKEQQEIAMPANPAADRLMRARACVEWADYSARWRVRFS
jgi:hypothetical protein